MSSSVPPSSPSSSSLAKSQSTIRRLSATFARRRAGSTTDSLASRSSMDSESTASCSSWASESSASAAVVDPENNKSRLDKIRQVHSRCMDLIISVIPHLDKDSFKTNGDDDDDAESDSDSEWPESPLDPTPRLTPNRNSLVLPHVPRPDTPDEFEWEEGPEGVRFTVHPYRATLACPPPVHTRSVRFSVPPSNAYAGGGGGKAGSSRRPLRDPNWSDFL